MVYLRWCMHETKDLEWPKMLMEKPFLDVVQLIPKRTHSHSLQEAFHFFAALRLAAACETTRESRLL